LFAENPHDQGGAGFAAARAHPGAGHGLDLVHVAVTLANEVTECAGGHALAAADDLVVGDARRGGFDGGVFPRQRRGPNPCDAPGDSLRRAHLDQSGVVVALDLVHPRHLHLAQEVAVGVQRRDGVAGLQASPPIGFCLEFVGQRHGGQRGVLAGVYQRDRQPGADGDAAIAAQAALADVRPEEFRQRPDVGGVNVDQLLRADGGAGVAGNFLRAVEHRRHAFDRCGESLTHDGAGA